MAAPPAKNDAVGTKAAQVLANSVAEGDPPSEAAVEVDWDFIDSDPSDYRPHLKRLGLEEDAAMSYRWCETDQRVWNRRQAQGWQPVAGGKVRRGTVFLCQMPKARRDAFRKRIDQRTKDLSKAPMRRLQQEADKYGGRHIELFDGERGPRDGL
jgi:hypothetical protein